MILNRSERVGELGLETAEILDFSAHKAHRQELRRDAAAHRAALELARCEAGRGDWTALMAALVAPFNNP